MGTAVSKPAFSVHAAMLLSLDWMLSDTGVCSLNQSFGYQLSRSLADMWGNCSLGVWGAAWCFVLLLAGSSLLIPQLT